MQPDAPPASTPTHTFEVASDNVCLNCHSLDPGHSAPGISNEVSLVIQELNQWAATKAPAALRTNGSAAIWEYTTPGGLIWQTSPLGFVISWSQTNQVNDNSGPNAAGQALIPDNIKKARFNLYLVVNDGSLGTHNWIFALNLLSAAENMIYQELYP